MKMGSPLYVFILGLALTLNVLATSHEAEGKNDEMALVCSPEKDKNCSEKSEHLKTGKDWTHKRVEQVAAVLPQPIQEKSKSDKPLTVKLSAPAFLSTVDGSNVKLEWTKSENAKVYHLQVSKDAGFNNRSMYALNNNAITETSFEVKNLEPNTKYFWRVSAVNGDLKDGFTKSNFTSSAFTTK